MHSSQIGHQAVLWYIVAMSTWPQLILVHIRQDKCDQRLSTRLQQNLHFITEKSAEPQLYLDKIENLSVSHLDWPFAIVRVGKAYLLLEDIHGAPEQFKKALHLLSPLQDEKFARYVEGLQAYVKVTKSPFVNTITRH